MFELPRRETEITVEIEKDIHVIAAPLTTAQYLELQENAKLDEGSLRYRISRQPGLFADRLLRIEGVQVDGQPFDARNPEHVERVPPTWCARVLARLINVANGLTEADLGNSTALDETSPEETSPAES